MPLKELLDEHQLFRRGIMLMLIGLTGWVTYCSQAYAFEALNHSVEWQGVVAVMGTIQAPILGLTGYAFKLYLKSRGSI
jgi:hypothetical protein